MIYGSNRVQIASATQSPNGTPPTFFDVLAISLSSRNPSNRQCTPRKTRLIEFSIIARHKPANRRL